MLRQSWSIFFFMTSLLSMMGQISDDFNLSNGQVSENWMGDRERFIVNSEQQLQLNDTDAGEAFLAQKIDLIGDMSWEMKFIMDFSPSSSNRLMIYLTADSINLSNSSGFVLQVGENGNQDAIELYRQEKGNKTLIAQGSMGLVADGPVNINLKVRVSDNFIVVETDPEGGVCFITEIETAIDIDTSIAPSYFGLQCIYTKTRSDKFFFDDIYVGPYRLDVTAPRIIEVDAAPSEIVLTMSEPINSEAILDNQIILTPGVSDLITESNKQELVLRSIAGFSNETLYNIELSNIQDLSANILDTAFSVRVAGLPSFGDLLINEILFNPVGSGADFIEIVNVSNGLISLNGLAITNSQNGQELLVNEKISLNSNEIVALNDDPENIVNSFSTVNGSRLVTLDIPRMNNDMGNVTLSYNDQIVDEFDYDEDFHHPLLDNVDGVSLERISLDQPTNDPDNWTSASSSAGYGTPGLPNSLSGMSSTQNIMELSHKIVSPNNDGFQDELIINYSLKKVGYVATVRIFSDRGTHITDLIQNEILGTQGSFFWDGKDQNGSLQSIGLYIAHIELFHLDGSTYSTKKVFGLGDFLR